MKNRCYNESCQFQNYIYDKNNEIKGECELPEIKLDKDGVCLNYKSLSEE
jgi:hypothetical protein